MSLDPEARALIDRFVARNYSLRGTLGLHRHALGWDLLKAPANVILAPLFFLQRLLAMVLRLVRLRRAAAWLYDHPLLLETALSAEVERRIAAHVLAPLGLADRAGALRSYGDTRSATGEMVATLGTLGTGAAFKAVTPGVLSLAPTIATTIAHGAAVAAFPLGGLAGSVWYGWFPRQTDWQLIILTALTLSTMLALLATFAGLITDPLQARLGIHQWRLRRLVKALQGGTFAAPEHALARTGDIADAVMNAVRWFRH